MIEEDNFKEDHEEESEEKSSEDDPKEDLDYIDNLIKQNCPHLKRKNNWYKQGGFSYIYLSEHEEKERIIKIYTPEFIKEAGFSELPSHNLDLKSLDNQYLMKVYDTIKVEEKIRVLICENCGEETLDDVINTDFNIKRLKKSLEVLDNIIDAVYYLNSRNLSHNDIKPENISTNPVKLLDYDTLSCFGYIYEISSPVTIQFASPEHIMNEGVNEKSDLFSIGTILFSLFENLSPYSVTDSNMFQWFAYCKRKSSIDWPFKNPLVKEYPLIKGLISDLLQFDHKKRPNIDDVRERYDVLLDLFKKKIHG